MKRLRKRAPQTAKVDDEVARAAIILIRGIATAEIATESGTYGQTAVSMSERARAFLKEHNL